MKVGDLVKSTVTNRYGIIIETFCGVSGKPLEARVLWSGFRSFETHESCSWLEVIS